MNSADIIEQDSIYRRLRTMNDPSFTGKWWETNPDWTLAHSRIKILLCPSDPVAQGEQRTGSAALFHSYDSGPPAGAEGAVMYIFSNRNLGKSNFTGVAVPGLNDGSVGASSSGGAIHRPYTGIFTNHSKVSLPQIMDGSSNTLMFGEGLGGLTPRAARLPVDVDGIGRDGYLPGLAALQAAANRCAPQ